MGHGVKRACILAGSLVLLLLGGCQSTPQADQLRQQGLSSLPPSHTISSVPFYPQQQYFCGPTTLSEVFAFYGVNAAPEDIAPKLFIPDKEGSLQLEMVSATRQYGFLPYTERGTLSSLMALVSDNIPVIVFQNLSISIWPQWHYALVIGFDSEKGTVTLHTGLTPSHEMSFELFERTWGRGNYWYMAPVPPSAVSDEMQPFTYVSAAYDLLKVGKTPVALQFLQSATQQWPSYWLSYFLLANHYLSLEDPQAVYWFEKGYEYGNQQKAYVHNYALALKQAERYEDANRILTQGLRDFPRDEDLKALLN